MTQVSCSVASDTRPWRISRSCVGAHRAPDGTANFVPVREVLGGTGEFVRAREVPGTAGALLLVTVASHPQTAAANARQAMPAARRVCFIPL
jgi:hypothetical protein